MATLWFKDECDIFLLINLLIKQILQILFYFDLQKEQIPSEEDQSTGAEQPLLSSHEKQTQQEDTETSKHGTNVNPSRTQNKESPNEATQNSEKSDSVTAEISAANSRSKTDKSRNNSPVTCDNNKSSRDNNKRTSKGETDNPDSHSCNDEREDLLPVKGQSPKDSSRSRNGSISAVPEVKVKSGGQGQEDQDDVNMGKSYKMKTSPSKTEAVELNTIKPDGQPWV